MYIIIVGGQQTAYFLTRRFTDRADTVVLVNEDIAACRELTEHTDALVIHGDGSDPKILEQAGARKADIVLAITPEDQDNLITCQIAMKMFGVPRAVTIVNDPDNEQVFDKLGVHAVFSTAKVIGSILDQETNFEQITEIMPIAGGKLTINDVRLDQRAPVVGHKLAEIELSGETLVAGIVRGERVLVPNGQTTLLAGDHLLVISTLDNAKPDIAALCGETH
jgi:trk system potassium uptake protein